MDIIVNFINIMLSVFIVVGLIFVSNINLGLINIVVVLFVVL